MKLILLPALLALSACTTPAPVSDATFGQAVTAAKSAQTIDPQAGAKKADAAGMDGAGAHEGVQRYRDSFKAPPPTFIIINAAPAGGK